MNYSKLNLYQTLKHIKQTKCQVLHPMTSPRNRLTIVNLTKGMRQKRKMARLMRMWVRHSIKYIWYWLTTLNSRLSLFLIWCSMRLLAMTLCLLIYWGLVLSHFNGFLKILIQVFILFKIFKRIKVNWLKIIMKVFQSLVKE